MKNRFLIASLIFFGLLSASAAKADTSTRGCETNTMKAGVFCNWTEGKSWCANNTNTCAVESTTACPANPTGGTYAFSCNSNSCVLSCNTGYTNCSGTCKLNITVPDNCTTFNQCTEVCSACAQGYELSGGSCIGATLKLSSESVGVSNSLFQSSNPVITIPSSGNVGIGTTTPIAKLEIVPTSGYSILAGNFKIGNVGLPTADGDVTTKGYVDSVIASATSSISNLWGGTTGGNIWTLNSGNVGIGTVSPTAKLEVSSAGGSGSGMSLRLTSATSYGTIDFNTPSGLIGQFVTTGASFASGSFLGNEVALTNSLLSIHLSAYGANGFIRFTTGANSTANERMRITNTGNVGIGTTVPNSKLNIIDGTVSEFRFNSGAASLTPTLAVGNLNASGKFAALLAGTSGSAFYFDDSGYFEIVAAAKSTYTGNSMGASGVSRLRIDSAGNVGIGTTTPAAKLEIVPTSGYSILAGNFKIGNVALPTVDGDAATKGYVDSVVASATSSISSLPTGTLGQTLFHNGTNWTANSVLYNDGTNIGIGTTTPTAKLNVYAGAGNGIKVNGFGTGNFYGLDFTNSGLSGSSDFFFYASSAAYIRADGYMAFPYLYSSGYLRTPTLYHTAAMTIYTTAGAITVGNASTTSVILNPGGNVGVGTTTPLAKLEVVPSSGYSILAGNYKIGNVALPTTNGDAATKGYVDSVVASATSSISGLPVGTSGQTLRYNGTGWVANSVIYNDGTNVGIGTTTTTNLFTVADLIDFNNDDNNTRLGYQAGKNVKAGAWNNTFVGYQAGFFAASSTSAAISNTAVGNSTLVNNDTGMNNSAFGTATLHANTSGRQNTAIGASALIENTVGDDNVAVGAGALLANTSGDYNTALGAHALQAATIGTENTAVGLSALDSITTGIANTALGFGAGSYVGPSGTTINQLSHSSIYIGTLTRASADGADNEIVIGNNTVGSGDNSVTLGNTDVVKTILKGNVGIGTTTPLARLEVVPASGYSILAGNYKIGNVALPTTSTDAATKGYVDSLLSGDYLPLAGGTMSGDINMGTHNISNIGTLTVNKINATTIDPLYTIDGVNYSTFAPSIAGGVKEEYVGKTKLSKLNAAKEYEAVIDFSDIKKGSDLWLWHKVVDFNKDSVDVAITPYGRFASVYYLIDGDKLVFRSDKAVEISYRLTAKRFDWRQWPTLSSDQKTAGFKIER